jgi:hypothetical protein
MTLTSSMTFSIAGLMIPDSKLAREITELVTDTEPPLLFHHSSRSIIGAHWQASVADSVSIMSCYMRARCSTIWV